MTIESNGSTTQKPLIHINGQNTKKLAMVIASQKNICIKFCNIGCSKEQELAEVTKDLNFFSGKIINGQGLKCGWS